MLESSDVTRAQGSLKADDDHLSRSFTSALRQLFFGKGGAPLGLHPDDGCLLGTRSGKERHAGHACIYAAQLLACSASLHSGAQVHKHRLS